MSKEHLIEAEALKDMIKKHVKGETTDNSEFRSLRLKFVTNTEFKDKLPLFVLTCRDLDEIWGYFLGDFESERTIKEDFHELLLYLETKLVTTPDFQKQDNFKVKVEADLLNDRIGYGGFGTVYKYRHPVLDMDFAVKIFEPVFASNEDNIEGEKRFLREAKMLFQLQNEHIV
ncbi:hypothetical protein HQN89_35025 [Paenibacillus frigoriresistens]|uniref:hypothetical protein n=1 Tax=Paenibacillus alginolyticus TaxID=59839 RepID=UPI001563B901|nr:hypothetical protein [Paenibacillus frigoriresistens]NRF96017.1 hypothetical protein [Paenibacillus frigoriresistens]